MSWIAGTSVGRLTLDMLLQARDILDAAEVPAPTYVALPNWAARIVFFRPPFPMRRGPRGRKRALIRR